MHITAAVTREADAAFDISTLTLDEPRHDEVLIRILGAGVCHTDLVAQSGQFPLPFPMVLGHEGAGIVERVGSHVTKVGPGDKVALSFLSCGECGCCRSASPAYCHRFGELNIGGKRRDGSHAISENGRPVSAHFFGQSSFANYALASERNVVKVLDGVPVEIAGVLGCGVQTGAGAVLRSLDCRPGSSLLVIGGGAVGLSAVMAAKVRGLHRVIVAEMHADRRALALELGATDAIDPAVASLPAQLLALIPDGVDYVLDTTGNHDVIQSIPQLLARKGAFGFVGVPNARNVNMPLPGTLMDAMRRGLNFRGIIEGDSDLDPFITELMNLYLAGRFPFDRLVRTWPLSEINEAVAAQARGECAKVVLIP